MKKSVLIFIFLAVSFLGFSESYWSQNVFAYLDEFFEIKIDRFADDEKMAEDFESVRKSAQKISSILNNPKGDKALKKLCKDDRTFRIISQRIAQKEEDILDFLKNTPPLVSIKVTKRTK